MTVETTKQYLSITEIAELTGFSRYQVHRIIKTMSVKFIWTGHKMYVSVRELRKLFGE